MSRLMSAGRVGSGRRIRWTRLAGLLCAVVLSVGSGTAAAAPASSPPPPHPVARLDLAGVGRPGARAFAHPRLRRDAVAAAPTTSAGDPVPETEIPVAPSGPVNIIGAFGSVWAVSEGNTSVLQRIDPRTNTVTGTVDLGYGPTGGGYFAHSGLTAADGSLWISEFFANQVLRIDPTRLRITRRIDVGRSPISVLGVGNSVWVANFHSPTLSRIDARTNRVTQTVHDIGDPTDLNSAPLGLAYVDGLIWTDVPAQARLYGIDARTGRVVTTVDAAPAAACGVLVAAPHALILDDSNCSNSYARFDTRTGAISRVTIPDASCDFGSTYYPPIPGAPRGVVITEETDQDADGCESTGDIVIRDAVTGAELSRRPASLDVGFGITTIGRDLWADAAFDAFVLRLFPFGSTS